MTVLVNFCKNGDPREVLWNMTDIPIPQIGSLIRLPTDTEGYYRVKDVFYDYSHVTNDDRTSGASWVFVYLKEVIS